MTYQIIKKQIIKRDISKINILPMAIEHINILRKIVIHELIHKLFKNW